jgi:tetratricopeptide (TPR) repeat protein
MMRRGTLRLFVIAALLISALALFACEKEKQAEDKTSGPAFNPYSSESVYEEVQKQLQKNPNDVDATYHLAQLYEGNGQYAQAIETYKKVIKLKPDMGYAYFKIGTDYDRLNQSAEAIKFFKEAEKYMPDYAVLYNNMGVAYGNLGKYKEEIAALKKALKLRPRYTAARFNLGIAYIKTGNKKAAKQEYEELNNYDQGAADSLLKEINKNS